MRGVSGGAGAGAGAGVISVSKSESCRSRATGVHVGEVAAGGVLGFGWVRGRARRVARRADSVACAFWRCFTSRARWWVCSAVCSPRWRFRIASSSARSCAADLAAMLIDVEL